MEVVHLGEKYITKIINEKDSVTILNVKGIMGYGSMPAKYYFRMAQVIPIHEVILERALIRCIKPSYIISQVIDDILIGIHYEVDEKIIEKYKAYIQAWVDDICYVGISGGGSYLSMAREILEEIESQLMKQPDFFEEELKEEYVEDIVSLLCAWFDVPSKLANMEKGIEETKYLQKFEQKVKRVKALSRCEQNEKLRIGEKHPKQITVTRKDYTRSAVVVAKVLERANGMCERCGAPAPFMRASDGTPYLEVHHKVRLADGGEDTIENTIAVCPNCHRELHFGE